jgi:tetratricopeptide (TPR) repeat protein
MSSASAAPREASTERPDASDRTGAVAQQIAALLFPDPGKRAERLGEIFLLCAEALRARPEEPRGGMLEDPEPLVAWVRSSLAREPADPPRSGALGLLVGSDARPLESDTTDTTDRAALALGSRALRRARSLAQARSDRTLLRNLGWYERRLAHASYEAIARAERRVPATIRTGVARARKFVLRVVHDLQHGQPAPLDRSDDPALERLRELWYAQELDALERALEETRARLGEDPAWLNLRGLLLADRGHSDEALACYRSALLAADAAPVRTRLLNNLGNLEDDRGAPERAREYWLRAHRLSPLAPTPLLNLLAAASQAHDYASAQHYSALLGELLGSGKLGDAERSYLLSRLAENPRLAWFRDTDAWRRGPARWLRTTIGTERASRPRLLAATALALLSLCWPADSQASRREAWTSSAPGSGLRMAPPENGAREWRIAMRGGDSMGKPATKASTRSRGGDSMGLRGGPRPRSRR